MQEFLLALGVALTILTITAIKSAKIRAAIYSLPIPITIILLGTGGTVNSTHPFSLLLVIGFMYAVWLQYEKLRWHILISITVSVVLYILAGLLNQLVVAIPFFYMYGFMLTAWAVWILLQPFAHLEPEKTKDKPLTATDYAVRGGIVFALTYLMVGLRSLILGASVTFPFNGIFTTYIMRHSLLYLVSEVSRNFIGVVNFFAVLYLLQGHVSTYYAFALAWIVNIISIYVVMKFIPRKRFI